MKGECLLPGIQNRLLSGTRAFRLPTSDLPYDSFHHRPCDRGSLRRPRVRLPDPPHLAGKVQVGSRVRLPFRNRASIGTVVDLPAESPVPANSLRPLDALIGDKPVISPVLIDLARWMADYYCCPVETAMRSVLPQVIRDAQLTHKTQLFARLVRSTHRPTNSPPSPAKPPARPKSSPPSPPPQPVPSPSPLCKNCGATHATIQSLVKAGFLATTSTNVERDPYENETFLADSSQKLTDEQTVCLATIRRAMNSDCRATGPVADNADRNEPVVLQL